MARAMWEGTISFGLVEIPVALHVAEEPDDLPLRMLDKRDHAPIGYQRINKETGKDVAWEDIVRGYEYEKGRFVVLGEEDLRAANPRMTGTIEISDFVDGAAIDPMYFERPYWAAPSGRSTKSYVLLREVLERTGKIGIARLALRTREHLAAVRVHGPLLTVVLLRFDHELRKPEDLGLPVDALRKAKGSESELRLAERLVKDLTGKWQPGKYHDTYRDDVMALIQRRVKAGKTEALDQVEAAKPKKRGQILDLMTLLKKSVEKAEPAAKRTRAQAPQRRRRAGGA